MFIIVVLIALLGSTAASQLANFNKLLPESSIKFQDTAIVQELPPPLIAAPTPKPVSPPVASKQSKPTPVPIPKSNPPQEPDSPPGYKHVDGFGYVKIGDPNIQIIADSKGDINKMVVRP